MKIAILSGVPIDFTGGGHRPAHLKRAFEKLGHQADYYYANYETIKPIYDLLLIEYPYRQIVDNLQKIRGNAKIIYDVLDDWKELKSNAYDKKTEDLLIEAADVTIAVSKELASEYQAHYVPNAVDLEFVDSKKEEHKDFKNSKKLIIGYVGFLKGWWFDWDIIRSLSLIPNTEIHIVGKCNGIRNNFSNVTFHEETEYKDIPAYINSFDVCIIPFKPGKLFNRTSPLKLYEYLAANKPVVSMKTTESFNLPNLHYADTNEDFVAMVSLYKNIKQGFSVEGAEGKAKLIREFVEKNTWTERAKQIMGVLK